VLMLDDAARAKVIAALSVEYSFVELEQLGDLLRREAMRRAEVQAEIAGLTERLDWDDLGMCMMLARREYHREYYQWRAALQPQKHAEELAKRNAQRRAEYASLPECKREALRVAKRAKDNAAYHALPDAVRKARKRAEYDRVRSDPEKVARAREQNRAWQARFRERLRAERAAGRGTP